MHDKDIEEFQEQNTIKKTEQKEWEKPEISIISTNETEHGIPAVGDGGGLTGS
ncbi:MAG: hypothetical protein PVH88_23440 [Ignavibacteria bacterium]|jgi:hypothetical protein